MVFYSQRDEERFWGRCTISHSVWLSLIGFERKKQLHRNVLSTQRAPQLTPSICFVIWKQTIASRIILLYYNLGLILFHLVIIHIHNIDIVLTKQNAEVSRMCNIPKKKTTGSQTVTPGLNTQVSKTVEDKSKMNNIFKLSVVNIHRSLEDSFRTTTTQGEGRVPDGDSQKVVSYFLLAFPGCTVRTKFVNQPAVSLFFYCCLVLKKQSPLFISIQCQNSQMYRQWLWEK